MAIFATWWVVPCRAAESIQWDRYNSWEIRSFEVVGAPEGMDKGLKQGLALSGQWKFLRGQQRPAFTASLLAADLARIRLYLAVRGFPAALVVPTVEADVASRQLDLLITAAAGPPVRVDEVRFTGWPEGVALPDSMTAGFLAPGQVFADQGLARSLSQTRSLLQNAGYALARVEAHLLPAGPQLVVVQLLVEAGEYYVIDEVVVQGCSADLESLALRVVNILPGSPYAESRLAEAAMDLRLTQLFRQVSLSTESTSPGHLRLKVDLENGRMRTWDASVGTWSDNPWMAQSAWTHRNLLGRGRGFNARGAFATHEMTAGVGVFWLGWLSPRARSRVGLDAIAENEEAYESREYRAEFVQSFRPRNRDLLNLGTAVSQNRIVEKNDVALDVPEPQGRLWEIWADRKWDRTDDPILPTRGGFLKLSLTFAEPWLFSEVPYASGQIDAAKYLNLPSHLISTTRLRFGLAKPLENGTDILANRRFHAGGYNSHRGYTRHGLGPRDGQGNARGGEAVVLFSSEVRFPLVGAFEGGLFLDAGNVWDKASDVRLQDIPVALGATLGLRSPLGPLRIGYAVNVADQVDGQAKKLWHFGIGYPW